MPPLGILGGTFDPIHFGHLRLAEEMADALALGRVLLIPAGQPPHRERPRISPAHRLEMVRRAIAGNPRFAVDDREVVKTTPSYTVETLAALRAECGARQPLCLLLGADAFHGLPSWHQWQRLFELAHVIVAARPGAAWDPDTWPAPLRDEVVPRLASSTGLEASGTVVRLPMTPLDISATAIRGALAAGRSVRYLLPDAALDYIQEHRLYLHHEH